MKKVNKRLKKNKEKTEKLTIEKLRTYPGFEDCTDEYAEKARERINKIPDFVRFEIVHVVK